jgi:antitoxin FitA
MAILHIRGVPDELCERLRQRATAENRSVSAEVVTLLERALDSDPSVQARLVADIRRRRSSVRLSSAPDAVALIREDRER